MSPDRCGTFRLPLDGTPDREAVDQFNDFLHEVQQRGRDAVLADPAWQDYLAGRGRAPTRCQVCGALAATTWQHDEVRPGVFVSVVSARECSADRTHKGGAR